MPKYNNFQITQLSSLFFRSREPKGSDDFNSSQKELSNLLKGLENGARELLPFVSRIKRNLVLGYHSQAINTYVQESRSARPRFVIITAVWQRLALTKVFYRYYEQLARSYSDEFELSMVVAGSEGARSQQLAESHGFEYVEVPNTPLSDKWQATVDALRQREFDAVIVIGSDDFLSPSVFLAYRDLYLKGANVAGFTDGHFYNTATDDMLYWRGYGGEKRRMGMPERVGESIGMGRMLSRDVLQQMDFQVWTGEPLNKGLDLRMRQNLSKIGFLHVEYEEVSLGTYKKALPFCIVTLKSGDEHMLLDVKYQTNVTDFENYRTNSDSLSSPFEHIRRHFGDDLVESLRSLAPIADEASKAPDSAPMPAFRE